MRMARKVGARPSSRTRNNPANSLIWFGWIGRRRSRNRPAQVVELVDALDSKSGSGRSVGSISTFGTNPTVYSHSRKSGISPLREQFVL